MNEDTALLSEDLKQLRQEVKELRESVEGLVTAWKTANNLVKFMKWTAGVGASLLVFYELFKLKI